VGVAGDYYSALYFSEISASLKVFLMPVLKSLF